MAYKKYEGIYVRVILNSKDKNDMIGYLASGAAIPTSLFNTLLQIENEILK
jgi:hypothetical protein